MVVIMYYSLQEIKRDNEIKGINACKIALYRAFLKCGMRTWKQVIEALERSGEGDMAKQVTTQLLKDFVNPNDIIYKGIRIYISMCVYIHIYQIHT